MNRVVLVVLVAVIVVCGCGSKGASKCVEGRSAACACPNGTTGAQLCNADGSFGSCSCAGSAVRAADAGSGSASCNIEAYRCADFSTGNQTGWKLHKLVFEARNEKRFIETICLAQQSINSPDAVLAGASQYELSYAWDGLGCRAIAIAAIEASLRGRPSDKDGWKETCARCEELKANCNPCKTAAPERIACPSMDRLALDVGDEMRKQAPSDTTWTNPKVEMCIPIGLPQPGWYVIGWVEQEAPDREFWFNIAVDARTSKVVAISEPEQRKYNYVCETKFGKVADRSGLPSTVLMRVDCFDKMGNANGTNFESEIVPPKIVLRPRK